jgi:hypothetical protein
MLPIIQSFFALLLLLPMIASAQLTQGSANTPFGELLSNILEFSNNILIPFIIGIGFLVFVFGLFQYFILGGSNDESREKGRKLMVSATFAFVIIILFFGFINLLTTSTGLEGETLRNIPAVPVP